MRFKEFLRNMNYDEFGKRDFQGWTMAFVFASPSLALLFVLIIIWICT